MSMVSISSAHAGTAPFRLRPIIATVAVTAGVIAGFTGIFADAAQAQVPTVNIRATCRAAATVTFSLEGNSQNDEGICLDSENKAREQMVKDWSAFEASDRAGCIQATVYLPSYVEWLTCFEMNKAVRQARQKGQAMAPLLPTNPDGSVTLPKVRNGKLIY